MAEKAEKLEQVTLLSPVVLGVGRIGKRGEVVKVPKSTARMMVQNEQAKLGEHKVAPLPERKKKAA